MPLSEPAASDTPFRRYRIAERIAESDVITSYYLVPTDADALPPFRAGQYLTLRIADGGGTVLRTYTVSSDPADRRAYRISVKREPPPPDRPHLPPGRGSGWLFEHGHVGTVLDIAPPRGEFVLDEASPRPVLLISGGVGLTPMVSMLHALAPSGRDVHFIHACEHGGTHALRAEVLQLAARHPAVSAHFVYRTPRAGDRQDALFHSEGLLTRERLRSLLPLDDYDAYLCGPPGFMRAVYGALRSLGLQKDRINYEFFGPSSLLDAEEVPAVPEAAASQPEPAASQTGTRVSFVRSNASGIWDAAAGSLLEFAESLGLQPDFSCRAGICGTCECRLLEGEVAYFDEPLDPPEAGKVLLCIARPRGGVRLDL